MFWPFKVIDKLQYFDFDLLETSDVNESNSFASTG
jgi:hypothetical protein